MTLDFNFLHPILLIKIITLVVILFYVIFTFIVFTQTRVMGEIISIPNAKTILRAISTIHMALAISLFIAAIVIL